MHKSIYSLVLSDEVMEAVDRLAYRRGCNRSQLINQILAEYVSYITPEQKIREAFGRISSVLDGNDGFRLITRPSDTLLSLGSALMYKYNPTVRYSVELFRNTEGALGELRVSTRTQNAALLATMTQFYQVWDSVECANIGSCGSHWEEGRYYRPLRLRVNANAGADAVTPDTVGGLIAGYIRAFDDGLKRYFRLTEDPHTAMREVERVYKTYLQECTEII